MATIEFIPIQPQHVTQAREIIIDNAFEFQLIAAKSRSEVEEIFESRSELGDLNNVQELYFNNKGTFIVALDGEKVIGMGAVKYFNEEICELKRMFFAKAYQGKGLGRIMGQKLIEAAKQLGYKKIRLWVYNPEMQVAAVALYKKLGFYEIPPYVDCKGKLFMEKVL